MYEKDADGFFMHGECIGYRLKIENTTDKESGEVVIHKCSTLHELKYTPMGTPVMYLSPPLLKQIIDWCRENRPELFSYPGKEYDAKTFENML